MKLLKTLLLTTTVLVAASASAKPTHFDGVFVGAELGANKAGNTKNDTLNGNGFKGQSGYKKDQKWGVIGGVLGGYRASVAQDVVLGVTLGVNLDGAKAKESISNTSTEVKRRYVVNLLGQAGYVVSKEFMPYVTAGLSFTQFKFSGKYLGTNSNKNQTKLGFAAGLGGAYAFNETVSTNLQYLYTTYGNTKKTTTPVAGKTIVEYAPKAFHAITVGVNVNI